MDRSCKAQRGTGLGTRRHKPQVINKTLKPDERALAGERVKPIIPSGGSLGSWVDEERSQLRNLMRIADTLSIDILNAHCGFGTSNSKPRLFEGCTSIDVQLTAFSTGARQFVCFIAYNLAALCGARGW